MRHGFHIRSFFLFSILLFCRWSIVTFTAANLTISLLESVSFVFSFFGSRELSHQKWTEPVKFPASLAEANIQSSQRGTPLPLFHFAFNEAAKASCVCRHSTRRQTPAHDFHPTAPPLSCFVYFSTAVHAHRGIPICVIVCVAALYSLDAASSLPGGPLAFCQSTQGLQGRCPCSAKIKKI